MLTSRTLSAYAAGFLVIGASIICSFYLGGCQKPTAQQSGKEVHAAGSGSPGGSGWPAQPPVQVCGNLKLLTGPASPPPGGAITVPKGDNSTFDFSVSDTTYWFAPGTHTLGIGEFDQIKPGDNSKFIGGPGAILDGQSKNAFAFVGDARNVVIRYLTIENFVAPKDQGVVNHDAATGWTIEYNTIRHNRGAGLMAGPNNLYRYNCIQENGQYGINSCCGTEPPEEIHEIENLEVSYNEITGNNTDDWEKKDTVVCGCTGGIKFWTNKNVTVTNNWIHHNKGNGLWLDNNNRGFVIENNYINDNDEQGLMIEQGYDALVRFNNFVRNGLVAGKEKLSGPGKDNFPVPAIYISEAGSPPGYGLKNSPMVISHNNFDNNWGGVVLWENPDRYAGSDANTSKGYGTIKIHDLYRDNACYIAGQPGQIPASVSDKYSCRWSTENVIVENNVFRIDKAALGCADGNYCGINGLFSTYGGAPEFREYTIPWRITFQQNNIFQNNDYYGDWHFAGFEVTKPDQSRVSWKEWTAPAPPIPQKFTDDNRPGTFGQDKGSIYHN